ncbi:hypothetical protein BV25DRAFT_1824982 [Artomyces pyxidatus]|uniref:Uncharacterized protein n=1 Tax=Artomyces pyxidatus TaxID=48021 RepID=A0ACB8T4L9_9AGAM|nr:hypothetical protein BV25DRAFT_1824982 [Artomyces pyxidatus]
MASAPLAIPDDHVAYTCRATWIHVTALCARRARGDNLLVSANTVTALSHIAA